MSSLSKIQQPILLEMEEFERRFCGELQSTTPLLQEILKYLLQGKGKRFRPMLVFLSAKMFHQVTPDTYTTASLVEVLHTATLVHDDVVDESDERRGHSSVNALWNSKIAVLVGDFLLSYVLHLSLLRKSYALLEVVSRALKEMTEGELLQIDKSRTLDLSEAEYYHIIYQKTAGLISVCTHSGALSGSCSKEEGEQMRIFGENLGMAFQIRDDLFDFLPGDGVGKPMGNDLKEQKLTLPLIYALSKSSPRERQNILDGIRYKADSLEFSKELLDFVHQYGGVDYARQKMYEFRAKSLDVLAMFPKNEAQQALELLVRFTTDRDN